MAFVDGLGVQPGSLGLARFRVHERKGLRVPDQALRYKGETPFVRVVVGDIASRRDVKIGPKAQGEVEILNGLKSGEQIVVRSSGFIADGEKVKVSQTNQDEKKAKN